MGYLSDNFVKFCAAKFGPAKLGTAKMDAAKMLGNHKDVIKI